MLSRRIPHLEATGAHKSQEDVYTHYTHNITVILINRRKDGDTFIRK